MAAPRRDASGKFLSKDAASTSSGGPELIIDTSEIAQLQAIFLKSVSAPVHPLLDDIGQQQEDSARRRLTSTKTSPSGTPWADWSPGYAKTRDSNHSLLEAEGDLADSMAHVVVGKLGMFGFAGAAVDVGSNLEYAAVHLYGSTELNIPARPYLDTDGAFADPRDAAEVRQLITDFIAEQLTKQ
jgi:phage gpG-like protein